MNITKVLGSRVLVKVIEATATPETDSGLVVAPTSINPSYLQGEVIGIGDQCVQLTEFAGGIKIGDKVAFVKYGYEDMGDGQYLVEENSLLATYE